jgi:hypothetical protein
LRRGPLLLAGLWAAVTGGLALVAGCYGHNCDGDTVFFGRGANEGHLLDANTWESNAMEAPWLPFPHQRLYDIDLAMLGDRTPAIVIPYVSANQNPDNFTVGSGNLTEILAATHAHVSIKNDTCADYYLRVVVVAPPAPPAAPGPADAGTAEGGTP